MDFFFSCGAILCGVLLCYVTAYFLHGWPVECPSAARMDNRTVLVTGKYMCLGLCTMMHSLSRAFLHHYAHNMQC